MGRDASRLTASIHGTGTRTYEQLGHRDQRTVDRMAGAVCDKSARIEETLRRTATYAAARTGLDPVRAYELVKDTAQHSIRNDIVARAEAGAYRNAPGSSDEQRSVSGIRMADDITEMAVALIEGAGEVAGSARTRSRAPYRPVPLPEPTHDRER